MKRNSVLIAVILVVVLSVAAYVALRILRSQQQNSLNVTTSSSTTVPSTTKSSTTTTLPAPPAGVKLRLLFLPVDWRGSMASFNQSADVQAQDVINNIPLSACPQAVEVIKVDKICPVGYTGDPNSCDTQRLNTISECAQSTGLDYDYAIGIEDTPVCGNTGGYSEGIKTVFAEALFPMVSVHELGHEWGLNDEYIDACKCGFGLVNAGSNCLDASIGGSDPAGRYTPAYCAGGSRCPVRYDVTCQGNSDPQGGRCIMSYANAKDPRTFCKDCMDYLKTIPGFNCLS